jgi:hypothetical protein
MSKLNMSTKEDYINAIIDRVEARTNRMEAMVAGIQHMKEANQRDLIRAEELRILRDISIGKIKLVDTLTGRDMRVRVFMPGVEEDN